MSTDEARDVLRRAFVAAGDVPPELADLLAQLVERAAPRAPRCRR